MMDLVEMAQVGSTANFKLVAQVDRSAGHSTNAVLNLPNWATAKRLVVQSGSFTEVADLGVVDTADDATLASFIQWGITTYPAQRYMLILSDHGGGWTGFGYDETHTADPGNGHFMSLPKIKSGITNGLAAAGLAKFDIIGFDACLMAAYEVAVLLKGQGSLLLASEESEPGHGWDYVSLNAAKNNPAIDAATLSRAMADGFLAQASLPAWNDAPKITLSVVDLSKVAAIEAGITAFTAQVAGSAQAAAVYTEVARQRANSTEFGANPDPANAQNLIDLGDFFTNLGTARAELASTANAAKAAIAAAVLYQVRGSAQQKATGMAAYFPPNAAAYRTTYDALVGIDNWRNFVKGYNTGASSGAVPVMIGATALASMVSANITLQVDLQTGSLATLASTTMYYGVRDSTATGVFIYGDQPGVSGLAGAIERVQGSWDYSFLKMDQGAYTEFGYLLVEPVSGSTTQGQASIPFEYTEPGTAGTMHVIWVIVFDITTGAAVSSTYYGITSTGQLGSLTPVTGSKLHPIVAHLADATGSSWAPTWQRFSAAGAGFDGTQPITLSFWQLPTGNLTTGAFWVALRTMNANGQGPWYNYVGQRP